jgi:putative two-component system response regulator
MANGRHPKKPDVSDDGVPTGAVLADSEAQLERYASDIRRAYSAIRGLAKDLEEAYYDTMVRLLRAARFKDEETGAHLTRISHYTRVVAAHLGLAQDVIERYATAAPLHDIGKIAIPDAILGKRGALNPAEWTHMKTHAGVGASLLKGSRSAVIECAAEIALSHHERFDGTGYPRGVVGTEIPLSGRIVMLVDQYDALRSARCYKPAFDHEKTSEIILHGDGRSMPAHFDPMLLEAYRAIGSDLAAIFERYADAETPVDDEVAP